LWLCENMILDYLRFDFHGYIDNQITKIKSPYFNMILKISKSSENDLKSDFVKSSIKLLNTLRYWNLMEDSRGTLGCPERGLAIEVI
jgi:hypothetical protein